MPGRTPGSPSIDREAANTRAHQLRTWVFADVFALSEVYRVNPHSEVRFGLYQELHAADAAGRLKGERQIDVHHVAQTRASITEAQPEARVLEKPETRLSQWRGPPCASRVEENGAADTEQPERI